MKSKLLAAGDVQEARQEQPSPIPIACAVEVPDAVGTPYLFLPLITEAVQLQSPQHILEAIMRLFT